MTVESAKELTAEIEDKAFHGEELPSGLKYPEQLLFLRFRYLYAYAKIVQMPPEQGKREKQKVLEQYVLDAFNSDLLDRHVALWKSMEAAVSAYRKNKTIENADKLLANLEGHM